jgi:RNA polymerase sigma-70 factor (ECF subfamily)
MGDEPKREANVQHALTASSEPAGDLEQIYREHHRRVIQAAYRITGNAQDAEDVLQTVFMRLVRREGGSPLSDSLGNYLHRAAINAALDVVRSRRSARSSALEGVEPTLADAPAKAPDKVHGGTELKEQIRLALGRMSAKAAEIFALRYFEGYGNHEIAKMLGTSRSTVNVILHRTREKLRKEMAPYLGERS